MKIDERGAAWVQQQIAAAPPLSADQAYQLAQIFRACTASRFIANAPSSLVAGDLEQTA